MASSPPLLLHHPPQDIYSVQPKVSIRVDGATELGTKISQSEAAAANVRVMPEPAGIQVWRWLAATDAQLGGSVDPNRDLWLNWL